MPTAKRNLALVTSLVLAGALSILVSRVASAQAVPAQGAEVAEDAPETEVPQAIETIVVTARRFEESLQAAPVAVSAFSADALEAAGATNLVEAGATVPNLMLSATGAGSGGSSNPQIFLRGVGQVDFLITTDPGVAVYVDGVYYGRTTGSAFDVLDLERLEVLRGPQGTLFGKNAIGGAIHLISRTPADELTGAARATIGSFDRYELRGSVDAPISDTLRSRFSLAWKNRDGYTRRTLVGDRMGDEDELNGRARFDWEPSKDLSFSLAVDGVRTRQNSANSSTIFFDPTAGLAPLWVGLVATPNGLSLPIVNRDTPFKNSGTGPNVSDLGLWGAALTAEWKPGEIGLKSITAYRELEAEFGRDGDNSPSSYIHTDNVVDQSQFTQEFQLLGESFDSRLRWVLGLYFLDESARDTNDVRLASGLFAALEGLPGAVIPLSPNPCPTLCLGGAGNPLNALFDLDFDIFNETDTQSYAAFGQGSFEITEKLSATLGLRYTFEDKKYFLDHRRVNSGVPIIPPTQVSADFDDISPRFGLEFQATDDVFLYFSAAKGFKSGGFNGRPTTTGAVDSFGPEKLWSYEVGAKTELFDRRMRLNAASFFNQYEDVQLTSVRADATGNLVLVTENAGAAESWGIEAELLTVPVEGLELSASVGFIDAEYTELGAGATITLDTKFVKTPDWTASAGVAYTLPLPDEYGALTLRGDWSFRGKAFHDVQNTPQLLQGAVSLVNARLSWTDREERFELAVFGTNLSDKRYFVAGIAAIDSFGTVEANYARPREWGLSLGYKF